MAGCYQFLIFKTAVFKQLFAVDGQYNVLAQQQHLTGYFVLFILSALFNGFNVRDDGFGIFKRLKENPDFLKVFFIIIAGSGMHRQCKKSAICGI